MDAIFQEGTDTRELFTVSILSDGQYLAARHESPKFAFIGATIAEVAATATRAFEFYRQHRA